VITPTEAASAFWCDLRVSESLRILLGPFPLPFFPCALTLCTLILVFGAPYACLLTMFVSAVASWPPSWLILLWIVFGTFLVAVPWPVAWFPHAVGCCSTYCDTDDGGLLELFEQPPPYAAALVPRLARTAIPPARTIFRMCGT